MYIYAVSLVVATKFSELVQVLVFSGRWLKTLELLHGCQISLQSFSVTFIVVVFTPVQYTRQCICYHSGLAKATAMLEECSHIYPSSAVFLFFRGLVSRLKVIFQTKCLNLFMLTTLGLVSL